jgi:hypothetical protein
LRLLLLTGQLWNLVLLLLFKALILLHNTNTILINQLAVFCIIPFQSFFLLSNTDLHFIKWCFFVFLAINILRIKIVNVRLVKFNFVGLLSQDGDVVYLVLFRQREEQVVMRLGIADYRVRGKGWVRILLGLLWERIFHIYMSLIKCNCKSK